MISKNNAEIIQFIHTFSDLSETDSKIINYIGKYGASSLKNIFTNLKLPKSTISYRIKLLENKDILLKVATIEKDKPIKLTYKGKRIFLYQKISSKNTFDHKDAIYFILNNTDSMFKSNSLEHRRSVKHSIANYLNFGSVSDFGLIFGQLADKNQAWDDLHMLVSDNANNMRREAAYALGSAFSHIPDKQQAWDDLHRLTEDSDNGVRWGAAYALGSAFSHIPDKQQAWDDLHRLTEDSDNGVRWGTAYALGSAFSHIPDKQQAWDDLHRLTEDSDNGVRWGTAYALGSAFSHIPDKQQAWDDLHRLTEDSDNGVRWRAAEALGNEYSHIPNDYKQQAWNDLYRLTQDKDYFARRCAAEALGNAYSHIPNKYKQQTLDDLLWLTQDEDSDVRALAYLSIGKIFIFRAVDAENEEYFKKEMEEAIRYFEKSSQQGTYSNPAKFCLPFYRSVYTITFKKNEADIHKYIAEAKSAVEGSESKEKLFEAVENLSNALGEMQKVKNFNEMKSELKAYLKYCERAAELLSSAEEKTPGAASILRKGLPIIDARIKGIIEEIQEKAKMVCKQTKGTGTPYEPLGCEVNQWAKKMMSEKDYFKSEKNVSRIIHTLGEFCKLLPPDKRVYTCDLIEEINGEEELGDKLSKIVLALTYLQPNLEIELCKNIVKTPESGEKTDEVASIKQKHIDDTALD